MTSNKQTQVLKKIFSCLLLDSKLRWELVDSVPEYDDKKCAQLSKALDKVLKHQHKLFQRLQKSNPEEVKKLLAGIKNFQRSTKKTCNTNVEKSNRKKEKQMLTSLEEKFESLSLD